VNRRFRSGGPAQPFTKVYHKKNGFITLQKKSFCFPALFLAAAPESKADELHRPGAIDEPDSVRSLFTVWLSEDL